MGVTKQEIDRKLQKALVGVYALCTIGGISAVVWQPPAMVEAMGWPWLIRLWAVFLLIGGLICFVGTLIPRGAEGDWFGELTGLPLVSGGVVVYGIVAARTLDSVPGRLCGICLLLAFALLVGTRWLRVRDDALIETGKKTQSPTNHTH